MGLREEILALPSDVLKTRDPVQIADAVSFGRVRVGRVERAEFSIWAALTGIRAKLEDHAEDKTSLLRSSALSCLDFIRGAANAIDFSLPENIAMLNAFVLSGVATPQQRDELLALATHDAPVSEYDVRCEMFDPLTGEWLGD